VRELGPVGGQLQVQVRDRAARPAGQGLGQGGLARLARPGEHRYREVGHPEGQFLGDFAYDHPRKF
jgi:hypothetical protein